MQTPARRLRLPGNITFARGKPRPDPSTEVIRDHARTGPTLNTSETDFLVGSKECNGAWSKYTEDVCPLE